MNNRLVSKRCCVSLLKAVGRNLQKGYYYEHLRKLLLLHVLDQPEEHNEEYNQV